MLQLKDPGNIRFFDVLNFSAKELAPDRRQPSTALAIWFAPRRKGTECPKESTMTTRVTETTAAPSEMAVKHFQEMLAFETDCWDVHESLKLDIRLRERARRQQSDVRRASASERG
jgi:hypothetical protein